MIEVIAEHSVEMSLLPDHATILDAGCRGFQFTNYFRARGDNVLALDIDIFGGGKYHLGALAGKSGRVGVKLWTDPNATTICNGNDVCAFTVKELCLIKQIHSFDLIKMDIEGSEYEVIMSMDRAYARQISVEFHLHTGVYGIQQVKEIEDKLTSLGYYPAKHDMSKQHGLGMNYWDSLWILQ